jgi:hypothetical protein
MTDLSRVKAIWQNWSGAPGYSTFYTTTPGATVPAVRTFFNSLVAYLPSGLQITVQGTGDVIDDVTGTLVGGYSVTAPAVVTGTGSGNFAGQAGAVVLWTTDTVLDGRRPMGKTYLVPLTNNAFDSGGALIAAAITAISNAATTLVGTAGLDLAIWHRPVEADPTAVPPIEARAGGSVFITGARVPDLSATMRSRRT